jgi:hypothetical protein
LVDLSNALHAHVAETGEFAVEARMIRIYATCLADAPASFFRHVDGARVLDLVDDVCVRIDDWTDYFRHADRWRDGAAREDFERHVIAPLEEAAKAARASLLTLVDHVLGTPVPPAS